MEPSATIRLPPHPALPYPCPLYPCLSAPLCLLFADISPLLLRLMSSGAVVGPALAEVHEAAKALAGKQFLRLVVEVDSSAVSTGYYRWATLTGGG